MTFADIRTRLSTELFDFERPSTRGEALFSRIFEALIVLWTLQHAWTWAGYIQKIESVVLPLGLANYLDVSVFFDDNLSYVLAGVTTVALSIGYLRKWKYAYAVGLLGFHLLYASRYSLGEISHGSNFIGIALLGFAIAAAVFPDSEHESSRFSFGFMFFIYGIGYTSAGICKLIGTGIDWPSAQHFALWVGERTIDVTSRDGVFKPTFLQEIGLAHPWVGAASLVFGLIAELVGILIWFRRYRTPVLLALVAMHVGIDLTLDILFIYNILILALLALPWGAVIDAVAFGVPLRSRRQPASPEAPA